MFEISLIIIIDSFFEYIDIKISGNKNIDKNNKIDIIKFLELIYIIINSAIDKKYLMIMYFFRLSP